MTKTQRQYSPASIAIVLALGWGAASRRLARFVVPVNTFEVSALRGKVTQEAGRCWSRALPHRGTFWVGSPALPIPSSCFPIGGRPGCQYVEAGPELGFSHVYIARGVQGAKAGRPSWLGMDGCKAASQPHPSRDLRRAESERAPAPRKTPPLKPGGSLQAQGHGVWSWGLYFFVLLCFVLL